MILRSIRWRLQIWHGLILVGVLVGFGVTAYQLERANRFQQVDQSLDERIPDLHQSLREGFEPPPHRDRPFPPPGSNTGAADAPPGSPRSRPGGLAPQPTGFRLLPSAERSFSADRIPAYYYIVWARDGSILGRSPSAPDLTLPVVAGRTNLSPAHRTRGDVREVVMTTPPGEVLLVGRSIATELAGLRRFAGWLWGAGGAVLAIGLVGGWFLASRVIRPIAAISDTAGRIARGNLSERIRTEEADSELGQLAAVLNDTFARLEATFAQQRQFTADASHELRTPLSVILAQTQMALSRERSPDEYRQSINTCQRAAQRMRRLIESLLELARLDAGQEPLRQEPVELSKIVREALEFTAPLAAERNVVIRSVLPRVELVGDDARLGQVVVNLVNNAIQYNRPNGTVDVSLSTSGDHAVLVVADSGRGIAAADLPHIFERFYRADAARSPSHGQTGLGLAITQAIVTAHRGTITVKSDPNVGTQFTVTLPQCSPSIATPTPNVPNLPDAPALPDGTPKPTGTC